MGQLVPCLADDADHSEEVLLVDVPAEFAPVLIDPEHVGILAERRRCIAFLPSPSGQVPLDHIAVEAFGSALANSELDGADRENRRMERNEFLEQVSGGDDADGPAVVAGDDAESARAQLVDQVEDQVVRPELADRLAGAGDPFKPPAERRPGDAAFADGPAQDAALVHHCEL
jgi:hypothetical protein